MACHSRIRGSYLSIKLICHKQLTADPTDSTLNHQDIDVGIVLSLPSHDQEDDVCGNENEANATDKLKSLSSLF